MSDEIKEIDVAEAKQQLHRFTIVDIRDPNSFASGHLPGAININDGNIEEFIQNTNKQQNILVCCYHGISSLAAVEFLMENGFTNSFSLAGGYSAWNQ